MKEAKRIARSGARTLCLATLLAWILITPVSSVAEDVIPVEVEAESSEVWNDLGGGFIRKVQCNTAHGGWAMDYIDIIGEWIEIDVSFVQGGIYQAEIGFQGIGTISNSFRMTLFAAGPGKWALRMSVTAQDGTRAPVMKRLLRWGVKCAGLWGVALALALGSGVVAVVALLAAAIVLAGFFLAAGPGRLTLHDRISGTAVCSLVSPDP